MNDLLAATADGSTAAYRELWGLMHDRLLGLAIAIVRDRDIAEDVCQEAMTDVWTRSGRFRPELGGAIPWMLHLARCRAIDRVRAEESDRARMVDAGIRELAADETPVDERWELSERIARMTAALDTLSPLQREAIRLTHLEGRTFRDAAETLGIPVGTLKTRAHDGMLRLREILGAAAPRIPAPLELARAA